MSNKLLIKDDTCEIHILSNVKDLDEFFLHKWNYML